MKLFLDTASLTEIERLAPLGLVDGVTSNPALLAREPGEPSTCCARSRHASPAPCPRR